MRAPASPGAQRFWSQSGVLLASQALVQGVNLGSGVLAVGILPVRDVGVISLQMAIVAWLYFTHAGTLNHLFNELPRLGAPADAARREAMLRGAAGVLLGISLPLTLLGTLPFAAVYGHEIGPGSRLVEFFSATLLAVFGSQWLQAKECDLKSRGEPALLARWNLVVATTSALPLLLLTVLPAYHVLLFRAPVGYALMAVLLWIRGERAVFRPLWREAGSYVRGGFSLVICQALSVLILQGERLLLAREAGVAVVGQLQLYFLVQTGVQLIPATATNFWFPRARREPTAEVLRESLVKALWFSAVALGGIALAGVVLAWGLKQGWAGPAFAAAAPGLLFGCLVVPAHLFNSLLFVFMATDRTRDFVRLQCIVVVAQLGVYTLHPTGWAVETVLMARAGLLYLALAVLIAVALRVVRAAKPAGI